MGRPSKPPEQRVNRHPLKFPWKPAPDAPWAAEVPAPPEGILPSSVECWESWFRSWFSGHWTESDVPSLRQAISLFDKIERGHEKTGDRSELRQLYKAFGLSPEGRNSLHWEPPKPPKTQTGDAPQRGRGKEAPPRLRVVDKTG